jgi:hypothetical protein
MRELIGMWQLIVIGLAIDRDGWAGFMKILLTFVGFWKGCVTVVISAIFYSSVDSVLRALVNRSCFMQSVLIIG